MLNVQISKRIVLHDIDGSQERMKGESESPIHGPLPMKIIFESYFWFCDILRGYFKDDSSLVS